MENNYVNRTIYLNKDLDDSLCEISDKKFGGDIDFFITNAISNYVKDFGIKNEEQSITISKSKYSDLLQKEEYLEKIEKICGGKIESREENSITIKIDALKELLRYLLKDEKIKEKYTINLEN
ncbi:hypothetical protein [Priestia aryabhattai]|uniref:hypothetical protein n=1 Tax=Priestia aryabhattai TaxID=412384 RepID=UPI0005ED1303|nr:hypothetical protein [Priestia aryabhattai]KJL04357.1 hypothetical protein N178_12570 [Priestia aryabhattai B8W22]